MKRDIIEEQKSYEAGKANRKMRREVMALALYHAAQLRGSNLTYEQILNYLLENDDSDYDCEPSPIEWERMRNRNNNGSD